MITVPNYATDQKGYMQGPTRVYHADYVPAGAEPPVDTLIPVGLYTKDGIEFDRKRTFSYPESDQSTYELDAFLTKQELEVKLTLQQLNPSNMLLALGLPPESMDVNPNVIYLGEVFDINDANGIPNTRAPLRAWVIQYPAPGYDQGTSPKAAWKAILLHKAAVVANGPLKVGKDHLATMQLTIKAFADTSISNATRTVGRIIYPT